MTGNTGGGFIRWPAVLGLALAALGFFGLVLGFPGCSRPREGKKGDRIGDKKKTTAQDHLEAAVESLRKRSVSTPRDQVEFSYAREAIEHLNAFLKTFDKPFPPLGNKDREWIKVTPAELAEIDSPIFTEMDAAHLGMCCQMGDIGRALDLQDLPTLDRARFCFEWVTRQVSLKGRVLQQGNDITDGELFSSGRVLQLRGFGTPLERSFIFLALLRQQGMNGCLIAVPNDKDQIIFWIPGVLVEKEEKDLAGTRVAPGIYLFDTRLGIPLPGPKGVGIATWKQVASDPQGTRSQFPGAIKNHIDIVPEQVAKAKIYLIYPLSALSPRMKFLQEKLTEDRIILAANPKADRERFQKLTRTPVEFWKDMGAPKTREEEGRIERDYRFLNPVIAWRAKYPLQLKGVLFTEIDRPILSHYGAFVELPRTALAQGQLDPAIKLLLKVLPELEKAQESYREEIKDRPEAELSRLMDAWCDNLRRAKSHLNEGGENSLDHSQAQKRIMELTSEEFSPMMRLIVNSVLVDSIGKEATYLICLCLQEKAEQLESKLERIRATVQNDPDGKKDLAETEKDAKDAWANALDRWNTFFAEYALTAQGFKTRLGKVGEFTQRMQADPLRGEIGLALYEQLAFDLSRSVAGRLLQARAVEKAGQKGALNLLERQVQALDALEKNGDLKAFKGYPSKISIFKQGRVAYANPENVTWLKATLEFYIGQLKKKS